MTLSVKRFVGIVVSALMVAWQAVGDVERARKRVNFSDWPAYSIAEQHAIKHTVKFMTSSRRMPLWYYVTMHPDARLSHDDLEKLAAWARDTSPEPSWGK